MRYKNILIYGNNKLPCIIIKSFNYYKFTMYNKSIIPITTNNISFLFFR